MWFLIFFCGFTRAGVKPGLLGYNSSFILPDPDHPKPVKTSAEVYDINYQKLLMIVKFKTS